MREWRRAVLWCMGGLCLWAQTTGPIEVKDAPPRRPKQEQEDPPRRREPPAQSKGSQSKGSETGPREIVTDSDGRVLEERGRSAAAPSGDPVIDDARDVAFEFAGVLPDFLCEQWTWRYSADSRPIRWKLRDRVEAEVLYLNGREDYRNVRVNGRPLRRGRSPEQSGSWSTGEFGTIQLDVMSHSTNAQFRYVEKSVVGRRAARKYAYTVEQATSHWKVSYGGYEIRPAYKGAVWIDEENQRVLRVEMQARQIPPDYPMHVVEMTVDYGMVRIAAQDYLLTVRAGNLACKRDSLSCIRNDTEFRNYRKFTADSNVSTTDSTVTFEGEEAKKAPPKQ